MKPLTDQERASAFREITSETVQVIDSKSPRVGPQRFVVATITTDRHAFTGSCRVEVSRGVTATRARKLALDVARMDLFEHLFITKPEETNRAQANPRDPSA